MGQLHISEAQLASAAAKLASQNANALSRLAAKAYSWVRDEAKLRLEATFSKYLEKSANQIGRARTFLSSDEPAYLYNIYVPLRLRCDGQEPIVASITKLKKRGSCHIVLGSGGSGKSTMMRHLFLDAIFRSTGIPICVDLRDLNESSQSLQSLLLENVHEYDLDLDEEFLAKAFARGSFVFLLDGFDEVEPTSRSKVEKEIRSLAKRYEKNIFVVSSRPDSSLNAWSSFVKWHT